MRKLYEFFKVLQFQKRIELPRQLYEELRYTSSYPKTELINLLVLEVFAHVLYILE